MAKVLVVDDDPSVVSYLKRVLASLGHEVAVATNGADGLREASSQSVNLIISDLNMPGEPSRIELIRQMRKARSDCPLVVISGYACQESLDECRKLGVTEFLTKPFEIGFIRDILNQALGSKGAAGSSGSMA